MQKNYLGIEIGGTKIQVFAIDAAYTILERAGFLVGDTKEATPILENLNREVSRLLSTYDISAVGLGFGGPIDHESGRIHRSFHVEGWDSFNLKQWLMVKTQQSFLLVVGANEDDIRSFRSFLRDALHGEE